MKKLVEVMAEKTLGFGQRAITPVTDEVKDNGANNRPVSSGGGMDKGSGIFFQDNIFDPMQSVFKPHDGSESPKQIRQPQPINCSDSNS